MTDEAKTGPTHSLLPELEEGVRYYLFIGCLGLLVLWLGLSQDFGIFALVPVLMGLVGLAPNLVPVNWTRAGDLGKRVPSLVMPPLMLLIVVIFELFFGYSRWGAADFLLLSDLLVAAGMLAYFLGQYRLYGLRSQAVPPDTRVRPGGGEGDESDARPTHLFQPRELRWPALVLPLCLIAGQLLWQWVTSSGEWTLVDAPPEQLGMRDTIWRLFSLVWLLGVGAIVLVGAGGIMRLYRMSGYEARMIAQDALWTETRGEQRRQNRWLTWVRRKRARKTGELP
jgi:hypothetical protein